MTGQAKTIIQAPTAIKRDERRPSNLSFSRGNTVSRAQAFREKNTSVGKNHVGTIKKLNRARYNPYGSKTSDGGCSDTGAKASSDVGFKGDFTPLLSLMTERGYKSLGSSHGYVASSDVVPGYHMYETSVGRHGVQPVKKDQTNLKQVGDWRTLVPPRQLRTKPKRGRRARFETNYSGAGKAISTLKVDDAKTDAKIQTDIVIDPYTQKSISNSKYGNDGDPNAFYPMAPLDPTEQQGYRPERMLPSQTWVNDPTSWGGEVLKIGEDEEDTIGVNVENVPETGPSIGFEALVHGAVQNYLWSRSYNTVRGTSGNNPITQEPGDFAEVPKTPVTATS